MIICGDCLEVMRGMEPNSVDSIVTDPPYGLSFMGKDWDHGIPGVHFWAEAIRVAKPGAHLLAFGGTRTFHRLACAIEDAVWEIRDCLGWLYGSGFPKSHNLKGEHEGWGTALKPAWEPIIMARKPLDGTVAANVQKWGTGAINVDGCRVDTGDSIAITNGKGFVGTSLYDGGENPGERLTGKGRWPANLLHDGSDEVMELFPANSPSGGSATDKQREVGIYEDGLKRRVITPRTDSGSAARFFYCAKASRKERGDDNNHPTVKPLALMRYLCRLVTPADGLVLDPFMGSGSTGIAARQEGFQFTGIDNNAEYVEIAKKRIYEPKGAT